MNRFKLFRLIKCFSMIIVMLMLPFMANAQGADMADAFRSSGKIYIVVAVVVCILTGILIYIFQTERKLNKLEKELKEMKEKK